MLQWQEVQPFPLHFLDFIFILQPIIVLEFHVWSTPPQYPFHGLLAPSTPSGLSRNVSFLLKLALFKRLDGLTLFCVFECFAYLCVCAPRGAWYSWMSEECTGAPPPPQWSYQDHTNESWEQNPGPLQEHEVLLYTEPSISSASRLPNTPLLTFPRIFFSYLVSSENLYSVMCDSFVSCLSFPTRL